LPRSSSSRRPAAGRRAAADLLRPAGLQFRRPADARALAERTISAFEGYDYVVAPSGSCAGMLRRIIPSCSPATELESPRVPAIRCEKTYELVSFLTDVMKRHSVAARFAGTVTYHDSCAGLRELGVKAQPRKLLRSVEGLELVENGRCRRVLRLRRHLLRQVSRHLLGDGDEEDADHIAATGAPPFSPAISAA
jgi:Fe-S oxidoreductase